MYFRFHVELHFSPGSYADFETFQLQSSRPSQESIEEDISHNSTENESISPRQSTNNMVAKTRQAFHQIAKPIEKKSAFSGLAKRFPIKLFNKELQTLPEPGDIR